MKSSSTFPVLISMVALLSVGGCGYSLRTSRSVLVEKEGIRRVYVSPLTNKTYKAGVENIVYNALVRTISASGQVKLVQAREVADAVLGGSVDAASTEQSLWKPASQLNPGGLSNNSNVYVATEYKVFLACSFSLTRIAPPKSPQSSRQALIWSGSFGRTAPFTASNQLGPLGTTSTLINDSEFNRTILELARSMMGDVNESMLQMF